MVATMAMMIFSMPSGDDGIGAASAMTVTTMDMMAAVRLLGNAAWDGHFYNEADGGIHNCGYYNRPHLPTWTLGPPMADKLPRVVWPSAANESFQNIHAK